MLPGLPEFLKSRGLDKIPERFGAGLCEEGIGLWVAGGDADPGLRGSGVKEGFDGFRGAASHPVGVDAGADGEGERSVAAGVCGVDGCAALDEEFYGGVAGSPCGYM